MKFAKLKDEKKLFKELLRGRLENLPEPKSKIVSIFLSSTFTDLKNERDYLAKFAFPRLVEYCKNTYNLEFQVIDMRWGIEGLSPKSNLSGKFCIDELKRCYEISAKPCFISLISHRYGSPYLPNEIEKSVFEILNDELKANFKEQLHFKEMHFALDNVLEHCYGLDVNVEPNVYRLKDLEEIVLKYFEKNPLPKPTSKNEDESEEEGGRLDGQFVKDSWSIIETKLNDLLQLAAKKCREAEKISHEVKKDFFYSVTEKEINEGILRFANDPNLKEILNNQTLVYIRNMKVPDFEKLDAKTNKDELFVLKRYFETEPVKDNSGNSIQLSEKTNKRLEKLKKKLRQLYKFIDSDNLKEFNDVEIDAKPFIVKDRKVTNDELFREQNPRYFNQFEDCFVNDVKSLIDREQKNRHNFEDLEREDPKNIELIDEVLLHLNFCDQLSKRFLSMNQNLLKIKNYLESKDQTKPLILIGDSGCGKTNLIAKTAANVFSYFKLKNNYSVIVRFLGTSPLSSCIQKTFGSIICQLIKLFDLKDHRQNHILSENSWSLLDQMNNTQLRDLLVDLLNQINTEQPEQRIFIFLDSIDQLLDTDYDLDWIPTKYPPNTKFVYSVITKLNKNILKGVQAMLKESGLGDLEEIMREFEENKEEVSQFLDTMSVDGGKFNKIMSFSLKQLFDKSMLLRLEEEANMKLRNNLDRLFKDEKEKEPSYYLFINPLEFAESDEIFDSNLRSNKLDPQRFETIRNQFKAESKSERLPIYIKMMSDIIAKMPSYCDIENQLKCLTNTTECINFLFDNLEKDFGKLLVSRCLFYLTYSADKGISDVEMADVLSLDDMLADHIFEFHLPSDHKFPATLWNRIRHQLRNYITYKEIDGVPVCCWYHRRFLEVATERYVNTISATGKDQLTFIYLCVFTERFDKKSPKNLKLEISKKLDMKECLVYTNPQPIELKQLTTNINGKSNSKKLNLRRLNRTTDLIQALQNGQLANALILEEVFLNYKFISNKFANYFNATIFIISNMGKQMNMVTQMNGIRDYTFLFAYFVQCFYMALTDKLNKYPKAFGLLVSSRLLSLYNVSVHVKKFIDDCDRDSFKQCALVATFQNEPFIYCNTTLIQSLFKEVTYAQSMGKSDFLFLYESKVYFTSPIRIFNLPVLKGNEKYKMIKSYISHTAQLDESSFSNTEHYGVVAMSDYSLVHLKIGKLDSKVIIDSKTNKKRILDTVLIGDHSLLVLLENSDHLLVYSLDENECYNRVNFKSQIKSMSANSDEKTYWTKSDYDAEHFVCILLQDRTIMLTECLIKPEQFESREVPSEIFKYLLVIEPPANANWPLLSSKFQTTAATAAAENDANSSLNFQLFIQLSNKEYIYLAKRKNSITNSKVDIYERITIESNGGDEEKEKDEEERTLLKLENNMAVLKGRDAIFIYDLEKKKLLKIDGNFTDIILHSNVNESWKLLIAYNEQYINSYLFQLNTSTTANNGDSFKIVTILEYLTFSNSIACVKLHEEILINRILLVDGTIIELSVLTPLFLYAVDDLYDKSNELIKKMIEFQNQTFLSVSDNNNEVLLWDILNGKKLNKFDLASNSERLIDLFVFDLNYLIVFCQIQTRNNNHALKIFEMVNNVPSEYKTYHLNPDYPDVLFTQSHEDFLIIISSSSSIENKINLSILKLDGRDLVYLEKQIDLSKYANDNKHKQKQLRFCLTKPNKYLAVLFNEINRLLFINLNEGCTIIKEISNFPSPDNKQAATVDLMHAIDQNGLVFSTLMPTSNNNNNNSISSRNIFMLLFADSQFIKLEENENNSFSNNDCIEMRSFKNYLAIKATKSSGEQEHLEELIVYDTTKATTKSTAANSTAAVATASANDQEKGILLRKKYQLKETPLDFTISNRYLATFELKNYLISLFRLDDGEMIAQVPLCCPLSGFTISADNHYIVLHMRDKRIITYLIADAKDSVEHNQMMIGSLPSRKENNDKSQLRNIDRVFVTLKQASSMLANLRLDSLFDEVNQQQLTDANSVVDEFQGLRPMFMSRMPIHGNSIQGIIHYSDNINLLVNLYLKNIKQKIKTIPYEKCSTIKQEIQ